LPNHPSVRCQDPTVQNDFTAQGRPLEPVISRRTAAFSIVTVGLTTTMSTVLSGVLVDVLPKVADDIELEETCFSGRPASAGSPVRCCFPAAWTWSGPGLSTSRAVSSQLAWYLLVVCGQASSSSCFELC